MLNPEAPKILCKPIQRQSYVYQLRERLLRHFLITPHPIPLLRRTITASTAQWLWKNIGITAFICLGFVSEGLAATTFSPTSLTYYAVQGASNPPSQIITVSRTSSSTVTLKVSDNATWLSVSPASTSMTTTKQLSITVNTSGQGAGTYSAAITIKVGTWQTKTIPVTLIVSPSVTPPPSTTSSATLTWNAVTSTTVSGYKVYVGTTPGLYSQTINVGSVTSYTIKGLTVGTTYYFVVTDYNGVGESAPSNMVSKTIQ